MPPDIVAVIQDCTAGSDAGRIAFPAVVSALAAAGVERYHADLRRAEKTYYLPDGESLSVPCRPPGGPVGEAFSATAVEAAIRAVQGGRLDYKGFCERILAAGCVGYHVSLAGRRCVYYGRTGETHVEMFPGAA